MLGSSMRGVAGAEGDAVMSQIDGLPTDGPLIDGARAESEPESSTAARATRRIFAGVVLATCGGYAAVTMAPIVAHAITGSRFLAGLPIAALLAGAGAGATGVAALIRRHGHEVAFTATYLLGALGCMVAVVAATIGSFPLLLAGVTAIGVGHAANQLARYTAADLHPEQRRPSVIGWMVWGLAIGAVLGPLSPVPAGRVSVAAGLPLEAGGFLVGAVLFAAAALLHLLGPRSRTAARRQPVAANAAADDTRVWLLPSVQIAVATMVVCLVVMLLVMTVTPVHVHAAGHGVGGVGAIMSAHTLGMFALAPVAGFLTTRHGSVRIILAGLALLAFAAVAGAAAPPTSQTLLAAALFALGFGWCLAFVAASSLLAKGLEASVRVPLQGRVEALTWVSGSFAAVGSGLLLGLVGFAGGNVIAGSLLVLPLAVIIVHRREAVLAGTAAA